MASKKKSFSELLAEVDAGTMRRVQKKLPSWAAVCGLEYPTSLALEQCSSELCAQYKAAMAAELLGKDATICDLTCGLGADSLAFSRIASKVISFERSEQLCRAATSNFAKLGAENIELRCEEVGPGTALPECDMVYADPARRDGTGKKVFRPEDCSPDILALLPSIFERSALLMLKLSPMADISMLASRLDGRLAEVHIISIESEVKELLCIVRRDRQERYTVTATELARDGRAASFRFTPEEESQAESAWCGNPEAGQYLLEPKAALMKSGAFKLVCSRFNMRRLGPSIQLYVSGEAPSERTKDFFKSFIIREVHPFGGQKARELGRRFPKAEVSARNLPLDSGGLRARAGIKGGGPHHIFGCGTSTGRLLIVSEKL